MTPTPTVTPKHKPAVVVKPSVRHQVSAKPTVRHAATPAFAKAPSGKPAGGRYVEAVGRRKTAIVRVRLYSASDPAAKPGIVVNGRPFSAYFPIGRHQHIAAAPLGGVSRSIADVRVTARATGGGVEAQAEALSLGLARAIIKEDAASRPRLKALGLLTRDPRMVESKKFGSRKARRPQQWRKR